jgi:integrase/recombinase XerD
MPKCKKCKKELSDDWLFCPWCGKKQTSSPRKTIKRENRTGSVYKRSDLKNRPWVAATPTKQGSQPQIIGHYETAQAAKDALDEYRRAPTTKLNITLKQVYEEWKPVKMREKSQKLIYGYDESFDKLSCLHDIKFRELRTAQMQKIIDDLQRERPKLDKKGNPRIKDGKPQFWPPMSYSGLAKIKVLLGLLYQYAKENDIVNKNYAEFLMLPKKPKGVKDCFNDIEMKKIENAVGKVPFADCVYFMCYTGLRITEFLMLNKFSVHRVNNVCALYGGIKTEAGENKIVPVHHKIQNILDEWLAKNGETIFCRPGGTPYSANYFRTSCYYPALEEIGVRRLTPHATRRTCATMMSTANVREEDFIAMMGHADFTVDIDSYIRQSAEKLSASMEKVP